jgi:hypothetical protein
MSYNSDQMSERVLEMGLQGLETSGSEASFYEGELSKFLFSEVDHLKFPNYTSNLGTVALEDLEGKGIGKTFLVAWNWNSGGRLKDLPVWVWLAKGVYIDMTKDYERLIVRRVNICAIDRRTQKVGYFTDGIVYEDAIPLKSDVVIGSSVKPSKP